MTSMIARPTKHELMPRQGTSDASNSRPAIGPAISTVDAPGGPASPAAIYAAPPTSPSPQGIETTGRHVVSDTRDRCAAGSDAPDLATTVSTTPMGSSLLDPALALAADVLDDLERIRIANQNRLRQLTRTGEDKDGEERGFGLDPDHPDVMRLGLMVLTLEKVEHEATLNLQRKIRKHPLGAWGKAQRGVGEKQLARLLAAIGDPYINSAKGAPRTVSALWAYCGLHVLPIGQGQRDDQLLGAGRAQLPADHHRFDAQAGDVGGDQHGDPDHFVDDVQGPTVGVAAKRRKGERANWSTKAKMRAYLIAESCMKQLDPQCRDVHLYLVNQNDGAVSACACSPYRVVYDARRAHTAVTHPDWSDGHSHNDALRVAAKEILKDLWREARAFHSASRLSPEAAQRASPSPPG